MSDNNDPLGTIIETEPEWICCCCEQIIPRPSCGFSTAVGSFCAECFLRFIEHLFNKTKVPFVNEIRDQSHRFIEHRHGLIEDGIIERPKLKAIDVRGKGWLKEKLQALICEVDKSDE